jgi:hypothetical protein
MSTKNRWVIPDTYDHNFPCWKCELPKTITKEAFQKIVRQIYSFAYDEELYRLVLKAPPGGQLQVLADVCESDLTWTSSGEKMWSFTEDGPDRKDCEEQIKISYYNNESGHESEIITEWIGRCVELSRKLRRDKYEIEDNYYHDLLPVMIDHNGQNRISVELFSDIWFPRVVGWIDDDKPFYDNSELAALNTPRLNRFLQRTKKIILEENGMWELAWSYEQQKQFIKFEDKTIEENNRLLVKPYSMNSIAPECEITEDGISLELNLKPRNHWCVWNSHGHSSESIPA